ncbi:MAG TPA: hypothetical protein DHV48_10610 [Prolixibacteraceae bacterium]|nr:hypothetical protein [Prolixibacteraceae bacterium]
MDYLTIGSNGFAQLGDPNYNDKMKAELKVLLNHFRQNYPVLQCFKSIAYYSTKTFAHDFGIYQEVVLWYNREYIEELYESESEADQELSDLFWTWFRIIEAVDLESEDLTDQIKADYLKSIDVSKAEHLSVLKAS